MGQGIKVYYDGTKFVCGKRMEKMRIEQIDSAVSWCVHKVLAQNLADRLNSFVSSCEADMVADGDFVVRKCTACGEYFTLTKAVYDLLKEKGHKDTQKCMACRD